MTEPYTEWERAGVRVQVVHDDDPSGGPQENDNAGTIYSWTRDFDGDERVGEPDLEVPCDYCEGEGELEVLHPQPPDQPGIYPCPKCKGDGSVTTSLGGWFTHYYDAVLTIPLRFEDRRYDATIYECDEDDANCALVFTQKEVDYEWRGHVEAYQVPTYRWVFAEPGDPVVGYADGGGALRERVQDGTAESGARPYAKARVEELDQWLRGSVWGIVVKDDEDNVLVDCWGFVGDPDSDWIRDEANGMADACAEAIEDERREAFRWACAGVVTV